MGTREPTSEMIEFFEKRTREHIERVRKCLLFLANQTDYTEELQERALVHDASKFSEEERIPYIWLTEFHRCKTEGIAFKYPEGIEQSIRLAVNHHMSVNRHHPEFHTDPNAMTDVDLIEMVCDWTAMSQEHNQNGGSSYEWAKQSFENRLKLSKERQEFVFKMIAILDSHFKK